MRVRSFSHAVRAPLLFAAVLLVIVVSGCGKSRPQTVEIAGKVSLNGGAWPGEGMVAFRPIKAANGYPLRGGHGTFDKEGRFSASTFDKNDGLFPGEYEVVFTYEVPGRGEDAPPKLLIEGKDQLIIVADQSGPLNYEHNVRRAQN
jgi:hypothetical protein